MADGTHMYWLFYSCIPVLLGNVISRLIRLKKKQGFFFPIAFAFFSFASVLAFFFEKSCYRGQ